MIRFRENGRDRLLDLVELPYDDLMARVAVRAGRREALASPFVINFFEIVDYAHLASLQRLLSHYIAVFEIFGVEILHHLRRAISADHERRATLTMSYRRISVQVK